MYDSYSGCWLLLEIAGLPQKSWKHHQMKHQQPCYWKLQAGFTERDKYLPARPICASLRVALLLSDQDDQHSTDERELISKSYLKCLPSEGSVMVVGSQKRTDQIAAKHEEVTCTTKLRTGTKFKRRSLRPQMASNVSW